MASFLNASGITILVAELTAKYDIRYSAIDHVHDVATTSADGFMSAAMVTKLNSLSNYTLPAATAGALGGIKIGASVTGKNYAVQLDSNQAAYVSVPWTDTTYSKATASTLGLVSIGYTTADKNYAVQLDEDGKMYVNVPWTDTIYELPATVPTSVQATGTAPLTLNASIAANKLTITGSVAAASASAAGSMSSAHFTKLEGIADGATADSALAEKDIKDAVAAAFSA